MSHSPRHLFPALVAAMSLAAVLLPGGLATAQEQQSCFGITVDEAEEAGYRVQIGTDRSDVLVGGNTTKDMIIGLGGDDVLTGAGGNDILCGGDGNDILSGGEGDDRIDAGAGDDEVDLGSGHDTGRGAAGRDNIVGGAGDDLLDGGIGRDRLSGGDDDDVIHGMGGADVMFGGYGDDEMRGGGGRDRVAGGPNRDYLNGGRGDDIMSGNAHRDVLHGGPGDDVLDGDESRDRLHGGQGRDRCDIGRDILRRCEIDFDGASLAVFVRHDAADSEDPAPAGQEPDSVEPAAEPDPEPTDGIPVPAAQAPQGVNRYGWPHLTDTGLAALLECESGGNHAINTGNGFYGGVQWLPATWDSGARQSGHTDYVGVLPHLVPAHIQDEVTKWWWGATRPNTQWPHCHTFAMVAMNVLSP